MANNLLGIAPGLSETERKLIADSMYNYDPDQRVVDYNDFRVIATSNPDKVIAALRNFYWVHGTTAALRLAHKLECKGSTETSMNE